MRYRLTVRHPVLDIPQDLPRYWAGGSPFKTHFLNAFSVLFPVLEQFAIKIMRAAEARLEDPELREAAATFTAQEGQHAAQHRKHWAVLRYQGYRFDRLIRPLELVFAKWFPRYLPLSLNLSLLAAAEHFTEVIAETALRGEFLSGSEPGLARLFRWHAVEEIEHKTVAFDVYGALGGGYALRMVAMGFIYCLLLSCIVGGELAFALHDGTLARADFYRDGFRFAFTDEHAVSGILGSAARYASPSFHPSHRENWHLAEPFLAELA